jgi:muramoyltetrapeptide carboxypeptidase
MLKPRALATGDRIAVVAPASPFAREEFDQGIEEIRRLGFSPVYDDSVFARTSYTAGPPDVRAAAILAAWRDPTVAGVIAVRGGYGSAQLLPLLDPSEARRACKPFVGYSDLTAVLTFLNGLCGMVAFHGPMLAGRLGLGEAGYDRDSFERSLCRREAVGEVTSPKAETIVPGEAAGILAGGTLTQLVASLGTPYAFNPPNGHILVVDEVGERPYRLDRMITQLRQAGLLARAGAVVFNELLHCDEPSGGPTARHIVAELFKDFPGPVVFGFPTGHADGPAITIPLGVAATVISGAPPRLVIEESAVQ